MRSARQRRGFSLVSAVFILAVLAVAGSFMLNIAGVARRTTDFVLLQARADQAARAGIEWGIRQIVTTPGVCPASTFTLTESTLDGFSVTVSCTLSTHDENGTSVNAYRVQAAVERGSFGSRDYVSRQMAATLTD